MNRKKRLWLVPESHNGKCLFCGKELEERFYSGSYETYLDDCQCDGVNAYRNKLKELREIMEPVDLKLQIIDAESELEESENNLRQVKAHLEMLKSKEDEKGSE